MDPSRQTGTNASDKVQTIDEGTHQQLIARILQSRGNARGSRHWTSIPSAENADGTIQEALGEEIHTRLEASRATPHQSNYTTTVFPLPGNAHVDHQIVTLPHRFGRSEGSFLRPDEADQDDSNRKAKTHEQEKRLPSFQVMKLSRDQKKRVFPLPQSRPKTWPKISLQRFRQTWQILQEEASLRPKITNSDHFVRELFARKLQENTLVDRMYRKIHRLPSPTGFKRSSLKPARPTKRNSSTGPPK